VKSRRAASSRQSSVKATVAWRPSVETSRRSVVTSTGPASSTAVTVPCARPVGTTLIPASLEQIDHLLGRVAGGDVDIGDRHAQQRVAHRAADEARHALARARASAGQPVAAAPCGVGQDHAVHCSRRERLTIIAAVAPQMRRSPQMIS
jgi:hypothetical protein